MKKKIESFECTCTYKTKTWNTKVSDIWCCENYVEFTVYCQGTKLKSYLSMGSNGNWICFPEIDKGCGLAELHDYYWNLEKLCKVLENIIDATSIASVLKEMHVNLNLWWDY